MSKRSSKKKQVTPQQKEAEKKRIMKKLTMLEAIEKIVDMAEDSKLEDKFLKKAEPYATFIAEKQGITTMQAIFISLFAENDSSGRQTCMDDLSRHLDCRNISLLKYHDDIEKLVRGRFLRRTVKRGDTSYYMPENVMKAFTEDRKFERETYKCDTATDFLKKFFDFTHENYEDKLSYDLLYEEIGLLFKDNENLEFAQKIKSLKLPFIDEMILTHFCRHLAINEHPVLPIHNLTFLLELDYVREELVRNLKSGKHILIKRKLIEYNYDDGFEDKESFRLTKTARQKLLKGFNITLTENISRDVIFCKDIEEKKLFYEGKTISQVSELTGLLSEENYKNIRARMKAQKMRCGFACIFYGAPGTGKTETALQLARMTGRNIMQVNISEIKSMWVGESEKNIKAIFDRYREQAKKARHTPILLFNEADAIIGKRREGAERAVDKMENSIQNIILQEMETLDGIMIATTNLEQNMDKAFERRFLYKVKFSKPSVEARSNIWRSMIPVLSDKESMTLAERYDFSGGQIENIARHYAIDNVLYGERENHLERLCAYSDGEKFDSQVQHKIGFV